MGIDYIKKTNCNKGSKPDAVLSKQSSAVSVCANEARDSWDEQDIHGDTQVHKQPVSILLFLMTMMHT